MISFVTIALALFLLVVKLINRLIALRKTEVPVAPTTRGCPYCLSSIPDKAPRCAFCTSEVAPA